MDEKLAFIAEYLRGELPMTALCERWLSPRDRHVGYYGGSPFHRRALSGMRHLGAEHDREKPRKRSRTLLSDRRAGIARGADRGGTARGTLLRVWPGYSLTWMNENQVATGEEAERLREGLRKAGVPEE
jgi:hypothetical protein